MKKISASAMLDYALLLFIVVTALIMMGNYIKRGLMFKQKEAADAFGFGRQYEDEREKPIVKPSQPEKPITCVLKFGSGKTAAGIPCWAGGIYSSNPPPAGMGAPFIPSAPNSNLDPNNTGTTADKIPWTFTCTGGDIVGTLDLTKLYPDDPGNLNNRNTNNPDSWRNRFLVPDNTSKNCTVQVVGIVHEARGDKIIPTRTDSCSQKSCSPPFDYYSSITYNNVTLIK